MSGFFVCRGVGVVTILVIEAKHGNVSANVSVALAVAIIITAIGSAIRHYMEQLQSTMYLDLSKQVSEHSVSPCPKVLV